MNAAARRVTRFATVFTFIILGLVDGERVLAEIDQPVPVPYVPRHAQA